jgi:DNA-binding transcriptional LysR family regulator
MVDTADAIHAQIALLRDVFDHETDLIRMGLDPEVELLGVFGHRLDELRGVRHFVGTAESRDVRLVVPPDHPLAGRAELHPEELGSEVMIARRSCEILGETSRYFTQRGVRPIFALRSPNDDRCMAMVAAGLGITTAPESLAREGVVAVKLADYDYRRAIGLVEGLVPPPQSLIAAARSAAAIPPARP